MTAPFHKVLIANLGTVAARLIRALRGLGVASVAVYSEADAGLPYLAEAGEAIPIGPAQASASYLNVERIIAGRHLFERDCSLQRRRQKIVEEAPAPALARDEIEAMAETVPSFSLASAMTASARWRCYAQPTASVSAPSCPAKSRSKARRSRRASTPKTQERSCPRRAGSTVFCPCAGPGLRVETGYGEGCEVMPFYDPMLAKVIAHAPTRDAALGRLAEGLASFEIEGVKTNIPFVLKALGNDAFREGRVHTGLAAEVMT
jgi:acetyl-CoA carboxylase biotin carboxylase subunit